MCLLPFPDTLREEKVISFNFTRERILGNAEKSISTIIIVMPSGVFVLN